MVLFAGCVHVRSPMPPEQLAEPRVASERVRLEVLRRAPEVDYGACVQLRRRSLESNETGLRRRVRRREVRVCRCTMVGVPRGGMVSRA